MMFIVVQREARLAMSNDLGQGLGRDARIGSVGCEGVTQIVESDVGQIPLFEDCFELAIGFARIQR